MIMSSTTYIGLKGVTHNDSVFSAKGVTIEGVVMKRDNIYVGILGVVGCWCLS